MTFLGGFAGARVEAEKSIEGRTDEVGNRSEQERRDRSRAG